MGGPGALRDVESTLEDVPAPGPGRIVKQELGLGLLILFRTVLDEGSVLERTGSVLGGCLIQDDLGAT